MAVAIDAVGGDAIAGEGDAIVERIPDGDEGVVLIARIGVVANAFGGGGEGAALERGGVFAGQELLRPEEEELVAVFVKLADGDGAADEIAGIVEAVLRASEAVAVAEELVGVEGFVANEVVGAAVEFFGAGFNDGVDGSAGGAAVFGLIVGEEHLDFGDGVD